jgi:RHS repeat-associated protein
VNGGQTVAYGYDNDGLVNQAGDLVLGRDPENGMLQSTTLGDATTSITPNAFGEIDNETAGFGSTQLFSAAYERDDLGRVTQKAETTSQGTHTYAYTYDPQTGFLTDVFEGSQELAHYAYDENGNRTLARRGGVEITADYDAQDRLTRQGATNYTYSKSGFLETKGDSAGTTQYGYDATGSLEHVTLPTSPSPTSIDYVTDGMGRRIAKKRDGDLEQGFLYGAEALGPAAELDAQGNVLSRFVYGTRPSVPDYMVRGGVTYRIVTNELGSPRIIVDADSGDVVQEMDYDEYGTVVQDTNPGFQPFGFAGGLYDYETGLIRFGSRDYDPEAGRWTAKDPISFAGGDTNLYGYVLNDPVNLRDPLGLDGESAGGPGYVAGPNLAVPVLDPQGSLTTQSFGLRSLPCANLAKDNTWDEYGGRDMRDKTFDELSRGGKPGNRPYKGGKDQYDLPNGGWVGKRDGNDGTPTIDFNKHPLFPGYDDGKIKYPEKMK